MKRVVCLFILFVMVATQCVMSDLAYAYSDGSRRERNRHMELQRVGTSCLAEGEVSTQRDNAVRTRFVRDWDLDGDGVIRGSECDHLVGYLAETPYAIPAI